MIEITISKNGIPIRLNDERWQHIIFQHPELENWKSEILAIVAEPDIIKAGDSGALIAIREIRPGKWLLVVYRELKDDGFIITAHFNERPRYLERRIQLWP